VDAKFATRNRHALMEQIVSSARNIADSARERDQAIALSPNEGTCEDSRYYLARLIVERREILLALLD
jgi:hypothetical protein